VSERQQDAVHPGRLYFGFRFAVHDGDRRHGAAADAGDGVQVELAVRGSLAGVYVQSAFPGIQGNIAAFHVAGGAQADFDGVLARRVETELVIESHHAVDIDSGNIEIIGDFRHGGARQVTELALDALQDGDKAGPLTAEPAQDLPGCL